MDGAGEPVWECDGGYWHRSKLRRAYDVCCARRVSNTVVGAGFESVFRGETALASREVMISDSR